MKPLKKAFLTTDGSVHEWENLAVRKQIELDSKEWLYKIFLNGLDENDAVDQKILDAIAEKMSFDHAKVGQIFYIGDDE